MQGRRIHHVPLSFVYSGALLLENNNYNATNITPLYFTLLLLYLDYNIRKSPQLKLRAKSGEDSSRPLQTLTY